MLVGNRLKELRESKNLSQGDIEKRTGLLRSYISRVENGHTVPAVETLEKMARALELPMYRLFHDGEVPTSLHKLKPPKDDEFGSRGAQAEYLSKLRRLLAKWNPTIKSCCCTWPKKSQEISVTLFRAQCVHPDSALAATYTPTRPLPPLGKLDVYDVVHSFAQNGNWHRLSPNGITHKIIVFNITALAVELLES